MSSPTSTSIKACERVRCLHLVRLLRRSRNLPVRYFSRGRAKKREDIDSGDYADCFITPRGHGSLKTVPGIAQMYGSLYWTTRKSAETVVLVINQSNFVNKGDVKNDWSTVALEYRKQLKCPVYDNKIHYD